MSEKNALGGGNINSLYAPMSEDEQECLALILKSQEVTIDVAVMGPFGTINGFIPKPEFLFGDKRIQATLNMTFSAPKIQIPVNSIDLELRWRDRLLLKDEKPLLAANNTCFMVGEGVTLTLIWDVSIRHINPELVKLVKPGTIGLTTRDGNTHYGDSRDDLLRKISKKEQALKQYDAEQLTKAKKVNPLKRNAK